MSKDTDCRLNSGHRYDVDGVRIWCNAEAGLDWAGPGYTATQTIDTVTECSDAKALGDALLWTARGYEDHIIYVKLPDGSIVQGYDVQAEMLTDGSVVYNLILKAE